jgi:hypothetical protein
MVLTATLFIKFIDLISAGSTRAITLWPFILLRSKEDVHNFKLLTHEKIHIKQQKELFILGFYVLYLYYYIKLRRKGNSKWLAYKLIPFEKEAYTNEGNYNYLNSRKRNSWKQYK